MSFTLEDHGCERILIHTKMYPPQLPPAPIVRARLLERLDEASVRRITLMSAPAGYGKTTLAVQLLPRCSRKVAWISLDPADNDPDRFLCYGVLLVLEDFQSIVSDPVRELVRNLVEYLPESLRLLLLSRTDPHLPLGRWRSKGWLAEIRQRDLRLEREEVRAFFADASFLGLSDAELTTLREKTEGWIAALQLAKILILHSEDPRESVWRFSGSGPITGDWSLQ